MRTSVRPLVEFLANTSPPKPLDVATSKERYQHLAIIDFYFKFL